MKVTTYYNNFSRGKLDRDLNGRFELPLVANGLEVCENFYTNFKGNAIYRNGFEDMLEFQDCGLIEFKFSTNQNYIIVLYENKMRFVSYDITGAFGWVLDGSSNILEVDTPYTLAESKQIAKAKSYTQNSDIMTICHQNHQPRRLIRESANSFTFLAYARLDDPFGLTYDSAVAITGITKASAAIVTTSGAHGYTTGDMVKITGVVGMTEINNYTGRITVLTGTTFNIDINTVSFSTYSSGGSATKLLTGDYPKTCLFYKNKLYFANTPLKPTTVWGSKTAAYQVHTIPATPDDLSALVVSIADIAQEIEWLYAGENSLIAGAGDGIVAINGGGVSTPITAESIEANITTAEPCSELEPIGKDGLIFYSSTTGRTLNYFRYDTLTESFTSRDANIFSYDITSGVIAKIRHVHDRDNLIWALLENGDLLTLNFYEQENILGWHAHNTEGTFEDIVQITNNEGTEELFCLASRNGSYFIERLSKPVEFANREDFYTGDESADYEAYRRYIAEQLKSCIYLDNATVASDLKSNSITYDSGAGTITATSPVFSSGDVGKHITYKTSTGYESGRFEITGYTSTTVVSVSVLQTPTANTYTDWYLSFSSLSGLTKFNGMTVSVVADGGYLNDFEVSAGTISFGEQVNHVVIGYKYTGVAKTFALGFQAGASNTQTTMKAVSRVGIRTNNSIGGKIGTSRYRMQDIHELTGDDLNYLPATPMDATKYITYTDDHKIDKNMYIIQDVPAPLNVTCMFVEANY